MRIRIDHETSYGYDRAARFIVQILRLTPRSTANQHVHDWRIDLDVDARLRQGEDAYGNVIPIFATQMLREEPVTVFGDGEQTRDFVSVHDVVDANIRAAAATGVSGVFNVGSATQVSINRLVALLGEAGNLKPNVVHGPERPGDVRDSCADIAAARMAYGYRPQMSLSEGLKEYMVWLSSEMRRERARLEGTVTRIA